MDSAVCLEAQLGTIGFVLAGSTPELLLWQRESRKWSAYHNLANLGRYCNTMLQRLGQARKAING